MIFNAAKPTLTEILFDETYIYNIVPFRNCFEGQIVLKSLVFKKCTTIEVGQINFATIPSLNSIEFDDCCQPFYNIFANQNSIEKVSLTCNQDPEQNNIDFQNFYHFLITLPSLNHLVLHGAGSPLYFDIVHNNNNLRSLSILDVEGLNCRVYTDHYLPRTNFLDACSETLTNLASNKLPYNFDGFMLIRHMFENGILNEINLRKNQCLLDGQNQQISSITVDILEICSLKEMFRILGGNIFTVDNLTFLPGVRWESLIKTHIRP